MYKTLKISALILGAIIVIATVISRPGSPSKKAAPAENQALSPVLIKKLVLEATLKDGQISGRFFNPNTGVIVTKITIEAVLKGDGGKSLPRAFNVAAVAQPNSRSNEFRVDAAGLDPERYALQITGALATDSP